MRIFGFLERKKQIAPAPSFKSSVHRASNGRAGFSVKRAKIKELLGAATPQECQEVDELLNRRPWHINSNSCTDDDANEEDDDGEEDDLVDDGLSKEGTRDHCAIATPQKSGRNIPDLQVSTICVDMAAQKLALPPYKSPTAKTSGKHAARKPCPVDTNVKAKSLQVSVKIASRSPHGEECAVQKLSAADLTAKASPAQFSLKKERPPRLTCISGEQVAFSSRDGLGTTSERTVASRSSRIREKKNASCAESFPLPSPLFEKHYLPTPRARAAEEVSCVAHPLPQPPTPVRMSHGCVLEQADEKGNHRFTRAVSCDVFVQPQISVNEYLTIAHSVSADPLRKFPQKHKTSQSFVGGFPMPTQGLQNTPSSTPLPLAQRTPQNTLPTPLGMQLHQMPQSTPPTTTPTQHQQTPQTTMTPHTQLQQTPQATPPVTPRSRNHRPQVFVNVPHNTQSPPSSNRQSPRVSTPLYSQSPSHLSSQHVQFAHSPPCSPLSKWVCPRKWKKGDILGQGTFGTVYKGLNEEDGSYFAVKVCSREDTSPEIQQEVDVLSKLEHPNIVRYLGSCVVDNRLCIFLELVRMGSLDSILKNFKRFPDHTIRTYTKQILLGLEYLHSRKTIHRDIKCGNILVDVNGQVKLSDFGIAKQVDKSLASSLKGTPLYMAPEVLMLDKNTQSSYSYPADIWSLGCTVFELAEGKPPWSDLHGFGFFFKVRGKELPPMPENLSDEGKDFIRRCLNYHPSNRPTASELLQHPFVSSVATPENLCTLSSPSSPLSPKLWQPCQQSSSNTWAGGHCCPPSPGQLPQYDHVLGSSQRTQSLIYGR